MKTGRLACLTGTVVFLLLAHSQAEEPAPPKFEAKIAVDEDADKPVIQLDDLAVPAKDVWELEKGVLAIFKKRDPKVTLSPQHRAGIRHPGLRRRAGLRLRPGSGSRWFWRWLGSPLPGRLAGGGVAGDRRRSHRSPDPAHARGAGPGHARAGRALRGRPAQHPRAYR